MGIFAGFLTFSSLRAASSAPRKNAHIAETSRFSLDTTTSNPNAPNWQKNGAQKTRKRRMKSTAGQRSLHFGYAENAVLSIRHQLPAEASLGQDARHAQTKQYGPVTTI